MGKAFDIGLERLAGMSVGEAIEMAPTSEGGRDNGKRHGSKAPPLQRQESGLTPEGVSYTDSHTGEGRLQERPASGSGPYMSATNEGELRGTFYLETFGCQMNEHDSEKVAGVLLARGYRQVESADAANVVLYNTCSIREKAAQKVFSRLGEWRPGLKESAEIRNTKFEIREEGTKESGEWPLDSAQGKRVAGGEETAIPQGLKPDVFVHEMSELQLRPPMQLQRETQDGDVKPPVQIEKGTQPGMAVPQRQPQDGGVKPPLQVQSRNGAGRDALRNSGQAGATRIGRGAGEAPALADSLGRPEGRPLHKKEKIIGVLGCVAQQEGEKIFSRAPWVSLVCGSASYRKLPELLAQLEAGNQRVTGLDTDTDETFETEVTRRDNPWRAYLTIIEGCDKACSYCVVPFTRGPERSRASASILEEVRKLADVGYTEVQLLGQTVNSYADPSARRMRFSELLVAVAEVPGIRRVRFTTSHPRDFGKDIVEAIEAVQAICDHVHLPVQSGSTKVLKAMARTYTRDEYLEKIAMLRAAKREISLTTDLIVGFPGETEKDFEETLSLLDVVQYDGAFSFKYSPRPNTPSLKMEDAIPEEEKSRRLAILMEKQREIQRARNERLIGQEFEVMVEGKSRKEHQWSGHTSSNKVMNFTSSREESLGDYVRVKVTGVTPNSLIGEVVSETPHP